mgnify:CR=1 FL=1
MKAKLKKEVTQYLKDRKGYYSLFYKDLLSEDELKINVEEKFLAASIIKIPIMIEYFRQLEVCLLDADELFTIPFSKRVGGSGILSELRKDIKMSFSELILLMIELSDNTATNLVIEKLGINNINNFLENRNYDSCLKRKMMDYESREKGIENYIKADEIGEILEDIYKSNFSSISKKSCKEMFLIMSRQKIRDKLSFYIPEDDWVKVASKTGTLDKVEHDGSIFDFENYKFVLVVLSKNLPTNAYGNVTIAKVAKKICGL